MNDLRLLPGSGTRGSVCLPVNKVWSYITYGASARGGSKTSRTGKHRSQLRAIACNKVPIWINDGTAPYPTEKVRRVLGPTWTHLNKKTASIDRKRVEDCLKTGK